MEALLTVDHLRVKYGDFTAVSDVSLSLAPGKVVSLIGANGAGKSSLLGAIAGLLPVAAGRVIFRGEDITALSADQEARRGLCLVPQGGRCFARMSVEDNLLVGSYPKRARVHRAATLEMVYSLFPDLREKRRKLAGTLSGGQRQMVAIGRALMTEPDCLLFDEISLGLAPIVVQEIYEKIGQINRQREIAILLVEQDTQRALRMSDECYILLEGAVSLSGPSASLGQKEISAAYFGIGRKEEA